MATPATLLQLDNLYSNSANLYKRLRARCALLGNYILGEDPGTANHAKRLAWANAALLDPGSKATQMLWYILADSATQAADAQALAEGTAPSDAQIQSMVDVYLPNFLV